MRILYKIQHIKLFTMTSLKLKLYFVVILYLMFHVCRAEHVSNEETEQSLTVPDDYCEAKGDIVDYKYLQEVGTTTEAMLKTELLPIVLEEPESDAEQRIKHRDFRFILINIGKDRVNYFAPSLNKVKMKKLLCIYSFRKIYGTSGKHESDSHERLTNKFYEYASRYNMSLIKYGEEQDYDFSRLGLE